jgi:hypothetical protein
MITQAFLQRLNDNGEPDLHEQKRCYAQLSPKFHICDLRESPLHLALRVGADVYVFSPAAVIRSAVEHGSCVVHPLSRVQYKVGVQQNDVYVRVVR